MLHTGLWCAGTGTTCTAPFNWECSSAGAPGCTAVATRTAAAVCFLWFAATECAACCSNSHAAHSAHKCTHKHHDCPDISKQVHCRVFSCAASSYTTTCVRHSLSLSQQTLAPFSGLHRQQQQTVHSSNSKHHNASTAQFVPQSENPAATQCSHFRRQQHVVSNRLLATALPPEHWLPCKYFQHIKIAR